MTDQYPQPDIESGIVNSPESGHEIQQTLGELQLRNIATVYAIANRLEPSNERDQLFGVIANMLVVHKDMELEHTQINVEFDNLLSGLAISMGVDVPDATEGQSPSERRSELLDVITRRAMIDGITNFLNRNAGDATVLSAKEVFNEVNNRMRNQSDRLRMTIAFLDVNYFKEVNDRFGHNIGDIVLGKFAEGLHEFTGRRPLDGLHRVKISLADEDTSSIATRHGGDEFVVHEISFESQDDDKDKQSMAKRVGAFIVNLAQNPIRPQANEDSKPIDLIPPVGASSGVVEVTIGQNGLAELMSSGIDYPALAKLITLIGDKLMYYVKMTNKRPAIMEEISTSEFDIIDRISISEETKGVGVIKYFIDSYIDFNRILADVEEATALHAEIERLSRGGGTV